MEKRFDSPGFYFQWHVLEACNLRCRHCYQAGYRPQPVDRQLIDLVIAQFSKALSAWNIDGRVSVTGGEPFMEPDEVFYILESLSVIDRIQHIGILTNGTLLTENIVSRLQKFPKLREVQVSLDGASAAIHDQTRGDGSFKRAVAGLELLKAASISTAIMFTVSKLNCDDAVSMIDFADQFGIDAITVERYTPLHGVSKDPLALTPDDAKSVFRKVIARKEKLALLRRKLRIRTTRPLWAQLSDVCGGVCPVGFSCLTVMHDGTVYPCRRLPIPLGKIQEDGIFKIWYESPVLWKLRRRDDVAECSKCTLGRRCGGCRAAAFAESGDFMARDPLCWRKKS